MFDLFNLFNLLHFYIIIYQNFTYYSNDVTSYLNWRTAVILYQLLIWVLKNTFSCLPCGLLFSFILLVNFRHLSFVVNYFIFFFKVYIHFWIIKLVNLLIKLIWHSGCLWYRYENYYGFLMSYLFDKNEYFIFKIFA